MKYLAAAFALSAIALPAQAQDRFSPTFSK